MSSPGADDPLNAYLQEAAAWDRDRSQALHDSVRRAWQVAALGAALAFIFALCLIVLLPLKHTEPFVIRVDASTGAVDLVPLYAGHLSAPDSVARYFLTHYVLTCERYNHATAESDYQECGAFHTARRNQTWAALWSRANPASPLNVHRDGSEVSIQITSLSFIRRATGTNDLAQVRYTKIESAADGQQQRASHWIATVQYAFAAPSQDADIRRWNPLGFKVIEFVTEPELIREAPAELPQETHASIPADGRAAVSEAR